MNCEVNNVVRVEESLDDILKLTTNKVKQKPVTKNTLANQKPGEYVSKKVHGRQENIEDGMDTVDIARYIEQEHNADSDVDLFS